MRILKLTICFFALVLLLTGCSTGKKQVKVLILPHFEIDGMAGDTAGEAQYFYENYMTGAKEYKLKDGNTLYYNDDNKVALAITGEGKADSASRVACILDDERFDMSQAYIVSPGCAGGNMDTCTLGDVCISTEAVDFDLGHTVDMREPEGNGSETGWFHNSSFDSSSHFVYNADLVDQAYKLTADMPLNSTELSREALENTYPDKETVYRDPKVIKGTSVTGDNYWKGYYNRKRADQITEQYQCKDPYVATEMEDVAIALVADRYGLKDRTIVLRGIVDVDGFWPGDDAQSLWGDGEPHIIDDTEFNAESLDIFDPCMRSTADVGIKIIDAILDGTIK